MGGCCLACSEFWKRRGAEGGAQVERHVNYDQASPGLLHRYLSTTLPCELLTLRSVEAQSVSDVR